MRIKEMFSDRTEKYWQKNIYKSYIIKLYKMRVFTKKTTKAKKWKNLSNAIIKKSLKKTKLEIEFIISCLLFYKVQKKKYLVKCVYNSLLWILSLETRDSI